MFALWYHICLFVVSNMFCVVVCLLYRIIFVYCKTSHMFVAEHHIYLMQNIIFFVLDMKYSICLLYSIIDVCFLSVKYVCFMALHMLSLYQHICMFCSIINVCFIESYMSVLWSHICVVCRIIYVCFIAQKMSALQRTRMLAFEHHISLLYKMTYACFLASQMLALQRYTCLLYSINIFTLQNHMFLYYMFELIWTSMLTQPKIDATKCPAKET